MENDSKEIAIFDKFIGELINYISDYEYEVGKNEWSKIRVSSDFRKWFEMHEIDWNSQISSYKNIIEMPKGLQDIAESFLPIFVKEHPDFKEAECLKLVKYKENL